MSLEVQNEELEMFFELQNKKNKAKNSRRESDILLQMHYFKIIKLIQSEKTKTNS